jgi:iron complex outermembrane recepter protein
MNTRKLALWATTALAGSLLSATGAWAQSTGSQEIDDEAAVEAVVVTGQRGARTVEGLIQAETAPKARSTVTEQFIETQPAGQTIFDTLNIVPGLNFVNNDPYGSSGGNVRLRGFDGNRISVTFDGIPLNDTGNYAIFTNQQLDPELITRANVNQGTTDVDSPTASAAGGTINYVTRRPERDLGGLLVGSVGSFNYRRLFGRFDTGEIGPFDTSAFLAASYQNYDKFRGPGELEKQQYNTRIYQDLGGGNFVSAAAHYNRNRNHFYNNITLADIRANGYGFDNDKQCIRVAPAGGTPQNESNQNTIVTSNDQTRTNTSCTSYHNVRINPSDTANLRGQSAFDLGRGFRLTFDPYFQYVIANGGGFTVLSERDDRLDQNTTNNATVTTAAQCAAVATSGVDLNGDGDSCDQVMTYTPNTTNTRRYGLTSSLPWEMSDNHRLRTALTIDYGQHRQTGEATFVDAEGDPLDVYGGKEGWGGPRIVGRDGSFYRGRDRFSIASLNQIAFQYRGDLMDDRLHLDLGVRVPFFRRELNQFCFSQSGSTNVRCTTELPAATLPNGNVRFASTGTTEFLPQYQATKEYDAVLPNAGVSYDLADNHQVFLAYAEGFSAPRTDNLYTVSRVNGQIATPGVQPETTQNWDLGYRYNSPSVVGYVTLFTNSFQNRIVSSFDQELGFFVDRNVGDVESWGVDGQIAAEVQEIVTVYFSGSYLNAEVQSDLRTGAPTPTLTNLLPTAGKQLVETPEWQFGMRVEIEPTPGVQFGLTGKYVSSRYSTDVNDQEAPEYTVWNADVRYDLDRHGFQGSYVRLNLINLFDEEYLGNISSQTNANPIPGVTTFAGTPRYSVGAPFTVQLSLNAEF